MKFVAYISIVLMLLVCSCSTKRNTFFSRNYHQLNTRYNVYFNGNQAVKSGEKNMALRHKEDYTNLLPVFVSNDEQTRALCGSDMGYATEKAAKAIDKHSITAKPRRRKNKDSKSYMTFRKKKEFNNELDKCYLLLGKAYFYQKKYTMANNIFRFIQRQYADDEEVLTETAIWMFRSLTEMERYDEAAKYMNLLEGADLKRKQRELVNAARTDFYVRQKMYAEAIPETEKLIATTRSLKRKPRYHFMLSQLYLKEDQGGNAMLALEKAVRFNFNYEMVFNAKINMALATEGNDVSLEKELNKMLRDSRNKEYQDRIYYALGNIEEKRENEEKSIDYFWKSVRSSVSNENQQALSFRKLGNYYFKERDYLNAQSCYDSCMYVMDSRYEDYDQLKVLLEDLTALTNCLYTIQLQDSLLKLVSLPKSELDKIIENQIAEVKKQEQVQKEQEQQELKERNFFERNDMMGGSGTYSHRSSGGEWYFYNPMTIALGQNEFKRKWGRRKLEDSWRRQNKAMVSFSDTHEDLAEEEGEDKKETDTKNKAYYLQDLPLTEESQQLAKKKVEDAHYGAGELYLYKFDDAEKALVCFEACIDRNTEKNNLPMIYYLASTTAEKAGKYELAEQYKQELIQKFPDSDFALGLQDPNYFQKVEDVQKTVEGLYAQAYARYAQVYYHEAGQICDNILQKYPNTKLKANILLLKAMCVLNTGSAAEGREVLESVLTNSPTSEIRSVVNDILVALSVGDKPVLYTSADMDQSRFMQSNRNWQFDKEVISGITEKEKTVYQLDNGKEHFVVIFTPEEFTLAEEMRFKARMTFIHAAEAAEGKSYELKKEELWYKHEPSVVHKFEDAQEVMPYLNRIATDKFLLKIIGGREYRMFAIHKDNLSVLKRVRNIENYIDFFAENYFENRTQGEILTGKLGTAAHVFTHEENSKHHFVLAVPFREVNVKRLADVLDKIDPAFSMAKEHYDREMELIMVKDIGSKEDALDYMNAVLKDKEMFDRLAGVDYDLFIITDQNLKAMQENEYLSEYMSFFNDNYLKSAGEVGVEDGDYIYNKSVEHKFVLIYPKTVDPFQLKTVFEEFNVSGLSINNKPFDETHDCMIVSGFNDKEECMRYFDVVLNKRKLFRSLRDVHYTNFITTDVNLQTLLEKKNIEIYLEFFKKYYLD